MAGFSVIPGLGLTEQLKYVAPRIGIQTSDEFAVSVGALYISAKDVAAGIAFAVGSIGQQDNSFTAGIGLGYTKAEEEEFKFDEHPIIMLGGNIRLSNSIAFVSEMVAARGLAMGRVKKVEIEGLDLRRTVYMARNIHRPFTRAQSLFWDFAQSQYKNLNTDIWQSLVNFTTPANIC